MKRPQETAPPTAVKPQSRPKARAAKAATPRKTVMSRKPAASNPLDDIRALRQEVAELKRRLESQQSTAASIPSPDNLQPWLKIAATVGVTFALGKIMQMLRLPPAAAVAVPMISAEVNRRFF
ncbi:hypothetical protein GAO09_13640 [Rhizobiales bacterium RZME27]|jgi:hypothetical protein|uniref:Uncharacterized protein n=1 Tax=Endobacterium cereale TaxID=2663029 RepID=A0A6A8ACX3_9HYPH|nr:hypothetical protein [Endobacterium cereale]MEB2844487.1 hypothetical protein [Endobacterium cereale]MQY47076.1 hypothetical protein [Endobacterium cereale]